MKNLAEVQYVEVKEDRKYQEMIDKVYETCFKEENLYEGNLYISIILSNRTYIQKINKQYRNIDKVTDVLSFPMFEKEEIPLFKDKKEVLGDIVICIPKIEEQAKEYGHSVMREFAYMLVHGFYHLMGYDHMTEEEKKEMREKEEKILNKIGLERV